MSFFLIGHQAIKKVTKIFHLLVAQVHEEQDKALGMVHHSKTMEKTPVNGCGAPMVKQLQRQFQRQLQRQLQHQLLKAIL